ncbi:hypothetical protein SARC_10166, partial [Sphaeroforma arctica JP610]
MNPSSTSSVHPLIVGDCGDLAARVGANTAGLVSISHCSLVVELVGRLSPTLVVLLVMLMLGNGVDMQLRRSLSTLDSDD